MSNPYVLAIISTHTHTQELRVNAKTFDEIPNSPTNPNLVVFLCYSTGGLRTDFQVARWWWWIWKDSKLSRPINQSAFTSIICIHFYLHLLAISQHNRATNLIFLDWRIWDPQKSFKKHTHTQTDSIEIPWLVVSTPLKTMKVSWDYYYSQYMKKTCSKPPTSSL